MEAEVRISTQFDSNSRRYRDTKMIPDELRMIIFGKKKKNHNKLLGIPTL